MPFTSQDLKGLNQPPKTVFFLKDRAIFIFMLQWIETITPYCSVDTIKPISVYPEVLN